MAEEARQGLHVRLLGPFMISLDGEALPRPEGTRRKIGRPVQWLLARLLLAAGEALTYKAIQKDLWPNDPGTRSVRDAASKLRHLIESDRGGEVQPVLEVSSKRQRMIDNYVLRDQEGTEVLRLWNPAKSSLRLTIAHRVDVDALHFDENIHSEDPKRLHRMCIASIHHDQFLSGCGTSYAANKRKEYEQQHDALWRKYNELVTPAAHATAVSVEHSPVRSSESSNADAIRHGEERREASRHDLALLEATQELPNPSAHLPLPLSSFVGRQDDVQQLSDLLIETRVRLVTLTGLGGWGKTRLALAAVRACMDRAPGTFQAAYFCDFAATDDASDIYARVVRKAEGTGPLAERPFERLVSLLEGKQALLLLDNFEGLSPRGGPNVVRMLERLPELTCLVTSRFDLGLGSSERRYPVTPLPLPPEIKTGAVVPLGSPLWEALSSNPSVELFADRAQAAKPSFALSPGNAWAVTSLCRRLDGIPLALELAAAWADIRTPAEMLNGIPKFELLISRQDNVDSRQNSLLAVLSWSFDLLKPEEQRFFAALSVFPKDFDFEAAAAVYGEPDAMKLLDRLHRHSMVTAEERSGETRYRLLDTVREFADGYLTGPQREGAAARHAHHFLLVAETMKPHLTGPEQSDWLARAELEHGNLRMAIQRYQQNGATSRDGAWRMAVALWRFWWLRGYLEEGSRVIDGMLAPSAPSDDAGLKAKVLNGAGVLAWKQGKRKEASQFFKDSRVAAEAAADVEGVATALQNSVGLLAEQGDLATARLYLEDSLKIFQQLGNQSAEAIALMNWGNLDLLAGDYEDAETHYRESLILLRGLQDHRNIAGIQMNRGVTANQQAKYAQASTLFREGLRSLWKAGDKTGIADALDGLSVALRSQQDQERLATVLGMSAKWRRETQSAGSPRAEEERREAADSAKEALGGGFEALWSDGYALTLEQIVETLTIELSQ